MKRKFYENLIKWKDTDITTPLMVVGARQIGKTYLINQFCEENFKDYIYINLMDNANIVKTFDKNINTEDKIYEMELLLNRKINEDTIIFFDEIQESEQLISSLKYFCESKFPYKIICAGSLLGVKLKRFSKSFPVGKVKILNMYPMNFEEFLIAIGYDMLIPEIRKCFNQNIPMNEEIHKKLLNYYRLYLCVGGMPASINNFIKEHLEILNYDTDILNSIINSYLADMKKYTLNYFETVKIEKVYKSLPSQLTKENKKFMYSKIEYNARKREYESSIEWLLASSLIVPSYYVNRFETPLKAFSNEDTFKLYINDIGILISMLNIPHNKILLDTDFMYMGAIAENYVAEQLTINGYNLYYWSINQVAEIDFLIDTKDGVIPIEVKSNNNTSSKSLNYYIEKNKPNYSIRISTKNFGFENNIKSVPLYAVFCIEK
jgi:hypothetical protein